jgi:hypothetical protein
MREAFCDRSGFNFSRFTPLKFAGKEFIANFTRHAAQNGMAWYAEQFHSVSAWTAETNGQATSG